MNRTGKLRLGIAFTICINQFHWPKNGLEGPKLEQSVRKNRTTFQMFRCSRKFSNDTKSSPFQPDFLETLVNGKQLLNYNWKFFRQLPALIGYFRVTWHLDYKTVDAFHSTKPFEIWKQEQVVQKFPGKSFQKFRKLLNFENVNHSTENSRNFRESKVEWKENLGIPHEVVLEVERNFKQDYLVEWKVPSFFPQTRLFKA